MAKIGLTEGFSLIPEGTHTFKITAVKYKEEFGKLEVTMQTQGGSKHIERFSLLKALPTRVPITHSATSPRPLSMTSS